MLSSSNTENALDTNVVSQGVPDKHRDHPEESCCCTCRRHPGEILLMSSIISALFSLCLTLVSVLACTYSMVPFWRRSC